MNWSKELASILTDVDVSDLSSSDIQEISDIAAALDLSDAFEEYLNDKKPKSVGTNFDSPDQHQ
jgi:hypothetical protein